MLRYPLRCVTTKKDWINTIAVQTSYLHIYAVNFSVQCETYESTHRNTSCCFTPQTANRRDFLHNRCRCPLVRISSENNMEWRPQLLAKNIISATVCGCLLLHMRHTVSALMAQIEQNRSCNLTLLVLNSKCAPLNVARSFPWLKISLVFAASRLTQGYEAYLTGDHDRCLAHPFQSTIRFAWLCDSHPGSTVFENDISNRVMYQLQ